MKLTPFLKEELTWVLSGLKSKQDVLTEISRLCASEIQEVDEHKTLDAFLEREKLNSTGEPGGIAFPHAMVADLQKVYLCVVRLKEAVSFGAKDNKECDILFVLIGGKDSGWEQIGLLARLGRLSHSHSFLSKLRATSNRQELFAVMLKEDALHV
jgi:PTS system nitrogen regulatory IIA component